METKVPKRRHTRRAYSQYLLDEVIKFYVKNGVNTYKELTAVTGLSHTYLCNRVRNLRNEGALVQHLRTTTVPGKRAGSVWFSLAEQDDCKQTE